MSLELCNKSTYRIFIAKKIEETRFSKFKQGLSPLTFNQVVRGSNTRTLMNEEQRKFKYSKGFRYFCVA